MLQQLEKTTYQEWLPDGTKLDVNKTEQLPSKGCEIIERGGIIFFPKSPFKRSPEDTKFLLTQHQKDASYHKNIAYRPLENRITGLKDTTSDDIERLRGIMSDFHTQAVELVEQVLSPYSNGYKIDFASYRPIEEKGRKMRLRARNDLIHVDSFATRPVHGDRILRVFENINPDVNRIWRTSDTFEDLAKQFSNQRPGPGDLDKPRPSLIPTFIAQALGIKANASSAYDHWMLNFHNFLKESSEFQTNCSKTVWEFPPGSSWIVYTDMVSHSVLSGQYALEQTFIVSHKHMVLPEKAPINILRKIYG